MNLGDPPTATWANPPAPPQLRPLSPITLLFDDGPGLTLNLGGQIDVTGGGGLYNPTLLNLQHQNSKNAVNMVNSALSILSAFPGVLGPIDDTYDTWQDAFNALLAILAAMSRVKVQVDLNGIDTNSVWGVAAYNYQISVWIASLNDVVNDMNTLLAELNSNPPTLSPPPSKSDVQYILDQANGWIVYLTSLKK